MFTAASVAITPTVARQSASVVAAASHYVTKDNCRPNHTRPIVRLELHSRQLLRCVDVLQPK